MTEYQKEQISRLRAEGKGYKTISTETGITLNTVKTWCRRHTDRPVLENACIQCGRAVEQTPHRKTRKFCSAECKTIWWNAHLEARKTSEKICAFCGESFSSYRKESRYCSRKCSALARRKVPQ